MATHKGEEKLIDFSQGQYLVFPYDDVKNIGPGLCFVLYNVNDEKDARLWKAADPKSCAYWMTAIRTAIRISRSTTTSSGDVKICNQMRKEIMGATIASEYVSILIRRMRNNYAYRSSNNNNDDDDGTTNNNHADGLRVPVAWVHSEMEKMDSNYLKMAGRIGQLGKRPAYGRPATAAARPATTITTSTNRIKTSLPPPR